MMPAVRQMALPSETAAKPDPRRRTVPLAVLLAAMIGALVAVSVLAVLAIGWRVGVRNTDELLRDKAELIVTLTETVLRDYLDPAQSQVLFLAERIESRAIDPRDPQIWRQASAAALAGTPQVISLVYFDADLRLTGVGRVDGALVTIDLDRSDLASARRAWAETSRRDAPYWGEVVYLAPRATTALNIRQGVRAPDGRLTGIVIATVSIGDVSRHLEGLERQTPGQTPFILYGEDEVLAHRRLLSHDIPLSEQEPLPSLTEIGDPVVAALSGARRRLTGADTVESQAIESGGSEYIVLYRALDGYGPRSLVIGTYFPREEVAQERTRLVRSGIAGLSVAGLAIGAGILMGRAIARPVQRLADAASRVGSLEFEEVGHLPGSRVRELDSQARAFNTMLAGLRWFETYVPRQLVSRLLRHGRQAETSVERDLTVMFTDIAGFTAASERFGAAQTAAFLNDHFALLARCVESEGGTIDKFIGDALMAFWGAPEEQPDHARRACRAACAIARAVSLDNQDRTARGRPAVRVRIGLHTGRMVVGNIGAPSRMNYTIVGDPVNTGQRLEQLGKVLAAGDEAVTILLSGDTAAQALQGQGCPSFLLQDCGDQQLRGRRAPIRVFRLRPHDLEPTLS